MKPTERAYLAGLIDGEGSIQARLRSGPHSGLCFLLSLANTDEAMVRWIASRWGGPVFTYPPRQAHHKQQWLWRPSTMVTVAALTDAQPYLVTKRVQADLVLTLARSMRRVGRAGYSLEERAWRAEMVAALSRLNARGAA